MRSAWFILLDKVSFPLGFSFPHYHTFRLDPTKHLSVRQSVKKLLIPRDSYSVPLDKLQFINLDLFSCNIFVHHVYTARVSLTHQKQPFSQMFCTSNHNPWTDEIRLVRSYIWSLVTVFSRSSGFGAEWEHISSAWWTCNVFLLETSRSSRKNRLVVLGWAFYGWGGGFSTQTAALAQLDKCLSTFVSDPASNLIYCSRIGI